MILTLAAILLYGWVQGSRPVYEQIESAMSEIDPTFSEVLHVHIDDKRHLIFYLTSNEEIGIVTLQKTITKFKLKNYVNKTPFAADKAISWAGTERADDELNVLYGKVQQPEVTQIYVVSEGDQLATIVKKGSRTMWYYLADEALRLPITLQAVSKSGEILYETGSVDYWQKNGSANSAS